MRLDFRFIYDENPEISLLVVNPNNGRAVSVFAYIDTGADATILDISVARSLGVELQTIEGLNVTGVGGGRREAQYAEVEVRLLELNDLSTLMNVVFVEGLNGSVGNLIGLDILSEFDLAISHRTRSGYLGRAE